MQPLPLEQAPTNGMPFLALLGLDDTDGTPKYREWRELSRGPDGVLRATTPLGDVWLGDVYSVNVVAMAYLPLPPGTLTGEPPSALRT